MKLCLATIALVLLKISSNPRTLDPTHVSPSPALTQRGRFTALLATSSDWPRSNSAVLAEEKPSSVLWKQQLLFWHRRQAIHTHTHTHTSWPRLTSHLCLLSLSLSPSETNGLLLWHSTTCIRVKSHCKQAPSTLEKKQNKKKNLFSRRRRRLTVKTQISWCGEKVTRGSLTWHRISASSCSTYSCSSCARLAVFGFPASCLRFRIAWRRHSFVTIANYS